MISQRTTWMLLLHSCILISAYLWILKRMTYSKHNLRFHIVFSPDLIPLLAQYHSL